MRGTGNDDETTTAESVQEPAAEGSQESGQEKEKEGGGPAQGWCAACAARVNLVLNPPLMQAVDGVLLAFLFFVCPQCALVIAPAGVVPLGPVPGTPGLPGTFGGPGGLVVPRPRPGGTGLPFGGVDGLPLNRQARRRMGH